MDRTARQQRSDSQGGAHERKVARTDARSIIRIAMPGEVFSPYTPAQTSARRPFKNHHAPLAPLWTDEGQRGRVGAHQMLADYRSNGCRRVAGRAHRRRGRRTWWACRAPVPPIRTTSLTAGVPAAHSDKARGAEDCTQGILRCHGMGALGDLSDSAPFRSRPGCTAVAVHTVYSPLGRRPASSIMHVPETRCRVCPHAWP